MKAKIVCLCTKCQVEINFNAGYYSYPSGIMCANCGHERSPLVEKALNEELNKMAKELRETGKIKH